jgi:hypothetical protein
VLIKCTNRCGAGCSHCMEGSTKAEPHMSLETFDKALDFSERIEGLAWRAGYRLILMSGGECTENPHFLEMLDRVEKRGLVPAIITNGLWLNDPVLRGEILRPGRLVRVQVTYDSRFYVTLPPRIEDDRVFYVDSLTHTIPVGRFKGKRHPDLPERQYPASFNLRSLTRSLSDVRQAILQIRLRAMVGSMSGHCAPSISHDGAFVAGENRTCFQIGTVDSSPEEVTRAVLDMRSCDRCTLERNLSQEHRRAIGLSRLFLPGEWV